MRITALACAALVLGCQAQGVRHFPDRPVAWHEHDDEDTPRPSESRPWAEIRLTHAMIESTRRLDRALALESPRAAEDVNALDEVPCSTWFCPRNHLAPLSPAEVAVGPPNAIPPRPPFRVIGSKDVGASLGLRVVDAAGRRYLLKLDVRGYLNLSVGAELVASRLAHAAGYNVPGSFAVELTDAELAYDEPRFAQVLRRAARTPDGKLRAAVVPWIDGDILGGFDFQGRREGDRNDRIRHEHRRSLRASYVLFAWLNVRDAGPANTLDTWIRDARGRRHVVHYLIDFGSALGSWTVGPKPPRLGHRSTLRALAGKDPEAAWRAEVRRFPSLGQLEAHTFEPSRWRTVLRNPAHHRRTPADEYWGAKVVTSFTDQQIHAAVAAGGYEADAAAHLETALRVRRDIIGRRWLTHVTAVEAPRLDGTSICFTDLAIARGVVPAAAVRYVYRSGKGHFAARARAARSCLPLEPANRAYRVVTIRSEVGGKKALPARIHLRDGKVVGLER